MLSPRPAYARFASFVGSKSAEAHSAKAECGGPIRDPQVKPAGAHFSKL